MSMLSLMRAVGRCAAAHERAKAREARERKLAPRVLPLPTSVQAIELEISDMSLPDDGPPVPRAQDVLWAIMDNPEDVDLRDAQRALTILRQRAAEMVA
jgi:hypothetical protein